MSYPDAEDADLLPTGTVVSHGRITCTNEVGGVATITPEGYVAATD